MNRSSAKRLLVYCSSTSWGGLEMNAVRYAGWFGDAGVDVTVACVEGTPFHDRALQLELPVLTVERNRKYLDVSRARALAKHIEARSFDVVWFRDNRDMDLLAWTKRLCRRRFRLVYHQGMRLSVPKRDPIHTWRFRAIDTWIALLDGLAERVVANTRFPPERIVTIPLGQEPDRFDPAAMDQATARATLRLPAAVPMAGIVGRLDVLKGQHVLIGAAARLHEQGTQLHVLLMGDATRHEGSGYEAQLHELVREHGLRDFVHFRPHTSDVVPAYRALDFFVMASAGESFGLVTIEAMLSGVCVVGSNAGGTPEIIGEAGALFEPGNIEDLTRCLHELVIDPDRCQRLARAGRSRALDLFVRDRVMAKLLAVVER